MLSKTERNELSELSKLTLGTRSAWQKMLKNGIDELVTRSFDGSVDGAVIPLLGPKNTLTYKTKYLTLDEVKALMLKLKEEKEKQLEEEKLKELGAKVVEESKVAENV